MACSAFDLPRVFGTCPSESSHVLWGGFPILFLIAVWNQWLLPVSQKLYVISWLPIAWSVFSVASHHVTCHRFSGDVSKGVSCVFLELLQ